MFQIEHRDSSPYSLLVEEDPQPSVWLESEEGYRVPVAANVAAVNQDDALMGWFDLPAGLPEGVYRLNIGLDEDASLSAPLVVSADRN